MDHSTGLGLWIAGYGRAGIEGPKLWRLLMGSQELIMVGKLKKREEGCQRVQRGVCSRSQAPPPKVEYLHLDTHPGTLSDSSDVLLLLLSGDQRRSRVSQWNPC